MYLVLTYQVQFLSKEAVGLCVPCITSVGLQVSAITSVPIQEVGVSLQDHIHSMFRYTSLIVG